MNSANAATRILFLIEISWLTWIPSSTIRTSFRACSEYPTEGWRYVGSLVLCGFWSEQRPSQPSALVGGFEPASNGSFSVGEVELHQALLTSLFSPVSDGLFTWSHQTFAEFLSAYYLIERGLNSRSLLEYLRPSEGARIPPQLREVRSNTFVISWTRTASAICPVIDNYSLIGVISISGISTAFEDEAAAARSVPAWQTGFPSTR